MIEWWARRFQSSTSLPRYIIVHGASEKRALEKMALHGAEIVDGRYGSTTDSLSRLATERRLNHVVLSTIACALGPLSGLDQMVACHIENGYNFTKVSGLPTGVGFWIFSRQLLDGLAKLPFSWLPLHPGLACQKLLALRAENLISELPVRIVVQTLGSEHGLIQSEMPPSVSLNTLEDIQIAREVLSVQSNPEGIDALLQWKAVQIRKKAEYLGLDRPSLSNGGIKHRPRILYASNAAAYSGAEESLCQLVRKIDSKRFELYAITGTRGRLHRELEKAGARVISFTDGFETPTIENFLRIRDLIKELKPDVVHANGIDGSPLLWHAIDNQIPFIQHVRNGDVAPFRQYLEAASGIIAVSNYVRERIRVFAVDANRIHVIHDEVDPSKFRPGVYDKRAMRGKYGIKAGAKAVTMIARYVSSKRHDLLLQAFERVKSCIPSAQLVLNGEVHHGDRYYDVIRERIQNHLYHADIIQIPFVEDIREIHALSDLVVLCGEQEGLGRCLIEAMAMGVPVVATASGGAPEVVEHNRTGVVVTAGDAEALAAGIIALIRDPAFAQRVSAAARVKVEQDLTAEISASRVMGIYERVLGIRKVN
jgi:glycosyltransferase involved in cell wall biosynthesis